MAEYEFTCKECGNHIVVEQSWNEKRPTICKLCDGQLARIWNMPNVVYRAGGFNTTDKRLEPKESDLNE